MARAAETIHDASRHSSTSAPGENTPVKQRISWRAGWVLYGVLAMISWIVAMKGWQMYEITFSRAASTWIGWLSVLGASSGGHAVLMWACVHVRRFQGHAITNDELLYASYCTSCVHALLACYGGYLCAFVDHAAVKALTIPMEGAFGSSYFRDFWLLVSLHMNRVCGYSEAELCIPYVVLHCFITSLLPAICYLI
jgi:hypothetical protein